MIYHTETNKYLEYICAIRGHVVDGYGWNTNNKDIIWNRYCSRCNAKIG